MYIHVSQPHMDDIWSTGQTVTDNAAYCMHKINDKIIVARSQASGSAVRTLDFLIVGYARLDCVLTSVGTIPLFISRTGNSTDLCTGYVTQTLQRLFVDTRFVQLQHFCTRHRLILLATTDPDQQALRQTLVTHETDTHSTLPMHSTSKNIHPHIKANRHSLT